MVTLIFSVSYSKSKSKNCYIQLEFSARTNFKGTPIYNIKQIPTSTYKKRELPFLFQTCITHILPALLGKRLHIVTVCFVKRRRTISVHIYKYRLKCLHVHRFIINLNERKFSIPTGIVGKFNSNNNYSNKRRFNVCLGLDCTINIWSQFLKRVQALISLN